MRLQTKHNCHHSAAEDHKFLLVAAILGQCHNLNGLQHFIQITQQALDSVRCRSTSSLSGRRTVQTDAKGKDIFLQLSLVLTQLEEFVPVKLVFYFFCLFKTPRGFRNAMFYLFSYQVDCAIFFFVIDSQLFAYCTQRISFSYQKHGTIGFFYNKLTC